MKLQSTLFVLAFALFACGGGETSESASSTAETPKKETSAAKPTKSEPAATTETYADSTVLQLASSDQMKYDQTKLTAKAGTNIVLTLTHTGKLDKAVMGHNFVLLKEGTDVAAFAADAIKAAANDYVPESDAIIAHTNMIGGGESVTIRFPAPEAGTYNFICTFPGHYALMKGEFIVY